MTATETTPTLSSAAATRFYRIAVDEDRLVRSWWTGRGDRPRRVSPRHRQARRDFADGHPHHAPAAYGWEYSPDGATLALGRRGHTDVMDAATRTPDPAFEPTSPLPGLTGRTRTVRFSDDGTLIASGGDSGRTLVRRL